MNTYIENHIRLCIATMTWFTPIGGMFLLDQMEGAMELWGIE